MPRTAVAVEVADWPALPYEEWKDTHTTLHLWTQIVGKIRLAQTPWTNHSWHVPLYVTARGLTTSPIPYGTRTFELDVRFRRSPAPDRDQRGCRERRSRSCRAPSPTSITSCSRSSTGLGIEIGIRTMPCEIPDAIPFDQDREHASYDAEQATRFWRALVQADRVFKAFRARSSASASPVHFFWGSFDLAVTRFSGRRAPPHPGGVPNCRTGSAREAYSHEVSSCGFWPGGEALPKPVFYAYAYPEPAGFKARRSGRRRRTTTPTLGEFVLPYEEVRRAPDPDATLLEFLQSSYEAAADLGGWDRPALEADFELGSR